MDENCILIDWFTCTIKNSDLESVIAMLGLSEIPFVNCVGHNGYKNAKFFQGVWILYDGSKGDEGPFAQDMGICVELSGQGCRTFETYSSTDLAVFCTTFAHLVDEQRDVYNISRLDVAYDDIQKDPLSEGLLDVNLIEDITINGVGGAIVTKFHKVGSNAERFLRKKDEKFSRPAKSVYFGARSSNVMFRVYDKAMERGGLDYHWVRFEEQLRNEAAINFLLNELPVGEKFRGLINNYLRFVDPSATDSNRWRWDMCEWWEKFLDNAGKVSVFTKKDTEYNLSNVQNYVIDQAGNSIDTLIQCVGLSAFMDFLRNRESVPNKKQEALIAEYKDLQQKRIIEYWRLHPFDTDRKLL